MKIKYVSFYTNDSIYSPLAKSLESDFKKYKLDYHIECVEPPKENRKHSWGQLCLYKPMFVLTQMRENPNVDAIIWVDIDTKITEPLDKFERFLKTNEFDIAVQLRPYPFACVMGFSQSQQSYTFVSQWIEENKNTDMKNSIRQRCGGSDQNGLARLIQSIKGRHAEHNTTIPKILSIPNNFVSKTPKSTFYEIQASRQVRDQIKKFGDVL